MSDLPPGVEYRRGSMSCFRVPVWSTSNPDGFVADLGRMPGWVVVGEDGVQFSVWRERGELLGVVADGQAKRFA